MFLMWFWCGFGVPSSSSAHAMSRYLKLSTVGPDTVCSSSMEGQPARNASKSRHQRKLCGHCDELLSYSAYRTHRTLYFNQSEQQWIREAENRDPGCRSSDYNNDDCMEFSDGLSLDEDDRSQTSSNTLST